MALEISVTSDVICPWCFIGKRRLEKAVAAVEGRHEVRVRWLPFQLNPTMPKGGISRREYRTRKFGSWERSLELDARVIEVGKSEGIHFAFDRIERTPNTLSTPTGSSGWPTRRAFRMRSWRRCSGPTSPRAGTSATTRSS